MEAGVNVALGRCKDTTRVKEKEERQWKSGMPEWKRHKTHLRIAEAVVILVANAKRGG